MDSGNMFWSSTQNTSVLAGSGTRSSTQTSVLNTSSEVSFSTAVPAAAPIISSTASAAARRLSNRARSYLWIGMRQTIPVDAPMVTSEPPPRAEVGNRDTVTNAAPREPPARPAPRNQSVPLVIDSLQNYELVKPIPVVVESLGDKIFTADAPDLNLSMSEHS